MAPNYKLTYFDLRARAEPTRLVFAYAGVHYEDVRMSFANRFEGEWSQLKKSGKYPFGQLPILEVDGVTLAQSMSILRFVAKRHGLAPSDEVQQAVADMFSEGVHQLEDQIIRVILNSNSEEQKVQMDTFYTEIVPKTCQCLEKILEENKKHEVFCVGNKLSYADICFFAFFNSYPGHGEPVVPDALKGFPRLTALYEKVLNEPRLAEWFEKRPKSDL